MRVIALAVGLAGALGPLLPSGALAGSYTIITIDPPGATSAGASSINASGQVVGDYCCKAGSTGDIEGGFAWQGGTTTVVDGANAKLDLELNSVDPKGLAAGSYGNLLFHHGVEGAHQAIVYDLATGKLHFPIDPPGPASSDLLAIGDDGTGYGYAVPAGASLGTPSQAITVQGGVASFVTLPSNPFTSNFVGLSNGVAWGESSTGLFTWVDGVIHEYTYPTGYNVFLSSLSGGRKFTGMAYRVPAPPHAPRRGFIYDIDTGTQHFISYPGAGSTNIAAITPHGIVGTFAASPEAYFGRTPFVRVGGVFHAITVPGAVQDASVVSVNADLSFVGTYIDARFESHAYVALCTPDQAPCTQ